MASSAPRPRKSVRWEDHEHPISDVLSIVDGVREERSSSSLRQNNQRTGSIVSLPPTVQPSSANKHLAFSTQLRPNAPGRREAALQTGPVRVHKPIKTKKFDGARRRRANVSLHRHHVSQHTVLDHTPPPLAPVMEEGAGGAKRIIIEVDEEDGEYEADLLESTPSSSVSSLDGDHSSRGALLPRRNVGSERFYKDLLDDLVSKRAMYETHLTHGNLHAADRRILRSRLREVKHDLVVLMRRRGDFQVVVAMSGLDEESKRECLGQLAKSILQSEDIIES